jgi:hypothetical protein
MNQKLFNSIQSNFKKFLHNKSQPVIDKPVIKQNTDPIVVPIEKTFGFRHEDDAIGYKITYTDKNGMKHTKISRTPTL